MSALSRRGFLRGAWLPEPEPEPEPVRVPVRAAVARVLSHGCMAFVGDPCRVCVDTCPVSGALSLVDGKPSVDAELCDGCGACERSCPAPAPGILAMPPLRGLPPGRR